MSIASLLQWIKGRSFLFFSFFPHISCFSFTNVLSPWAYLWLTPVSPSLIPSLIKGGFLGIVDWCCEQFSHNRASLFFFAMFTQHWLSHYSNIGPKQNLQTFCQLYFYLFSQKANLVNLSMILLFENLNLRSKLFKEL